MRTATIAVDAGAVSPSKALAVVARASDRTLVVVTSRMFGELERELGDAEAVARRLATIATNVGRPLAVNLETPEGSTTVFIAPRGWSDERLRGWAAGHHEALQAMFGPAPVRPLEDL